MSTRSKDPAVRIVCGHVPGVIGAVVALQADYYSRAWGFGVEFEAECASGLGEYFRRYDPRRDAFFSAWDGERCVGAAAIDGSSSRPGTAQVRWVIVHPQHHGRGIGARLMEEAMAFCRRVGFRTVTLHTFAGLRAARRLYERYGFRLVREQPDFGEFGPPVTLQFMAWRPDDAAAPPA